VGQVLKSIPFHKEKWIFSIHLLGDPDLPGLTDGHLALPYTMVYRILPWKLFLQRAARRAQFIDPVDLIARLRKFSQPADVQEPVELLRAGIRFHARGLLNTKAIQHNLDWIWPMWVERQFSPEDPSFIPRAFSFSHVNLTHRNWTAVGLPGYSVMPVVDPNGLLTPLYDGWSLDLFLKASDGSLLAPSKSSRVKQYMEDGIEPVVVTEVENSSSVLRSRIFARQGEDGPECVCQAEVENGGDDLLFVALRPYNAEGVQLIENIDNSSLRTVKVNRNQLFHFSENPVWHRFSTYAEGDVVRQAGKPSGTGEIQCSTGMATGIWAFPGQNRIEVRIPLESERRRLSPHEPKPQTSSWQKALEGAASLQIPHDTYQRLFDNALKTLVLLSPETIFPGPYTYQRFWFRDACLMGNALLATNLPERVENCLPHFLSQQKANGYFHSQEGEWDSNGQVLWLLERYLVSTGRSLSKDWLKPMRKAARWIIRHRKSSSGAKDGLFPAGFSAEHLGPVDHYYWDNFWGVAGLLAAARIEKTMGNNEEADHWKREGGYFLKAVEDSFHTARIQKAIAAAPGRRMDAGAIGSMVADYPLQIFPDDYERLDQTLNWLMENCMLRDGFFQDMIHSGINPYLTLALAQSLLRRGDPGYQKLLSSIAELASPTGNWPEAIHPQTGGGCMGDGQHGWAAAEWVMMIRNLFVREEGNTLVLLSGLDREWLKPGNRLFFGPTLTPSGRLSVTVRVHEAHLDISIDPVWNEARPSICIRLPGRPMEIMKEDHFIMNLKPLEK